MKIRMVPIDSVIPYERNPRKNLGAVKKVAASLKEFGWQQPIVVDSANVLIVGHTRLLAAKSLGQTEVPVTVARELSADQVKAYRIADNRTGEEASWDHELLALEIRDLDLAGFSLELTAFDEGEIAALFPAEDDLPTSEEAEGTTFRQPTLRWGDHEVKMSQEEVEAIDRAYDRHYKANGVAFGFVAQLLGHV